jgi:hypothetical protein
MLIGPDAALADSLAYGRVPDTVPLAPDEATARQLLLGRPPAVARHLELDGDSSSSRRARLFLRAASRDCELDAVGDDAVLVASELLGNAVAHARTSCRLDIRLDRLGLTVAVRDYDYRGLLVPLACSTSGRREHGLFLVASISRAWGSARPRTARACGRSCRSRTGDRVRQPVEAADPASMSAALTAMTIPRAPVMF